MRCQVLFFLLLRETRSEKSTPSKRHKDSLLLQLESCLYGADETKLHFFFVLKNWCIQGNAPLLYKCKIYQWINGGCFFFQHHHFWNLVASARRIRLWKCGKFKSPHNCMGRQYLSDTNFNSSLYRIRIQFHFKHHSFHALVF